MLAVVVIVYAILIFPLFININIQYTKGTKILEYNIKLFSFIRVLFGYIELIDEGIIIHINNKKAILIFYNNLFSMRKKFKPLKDYHIFRFNTNISIGILDDEVQKLKLVFMYNYIFNVVGQCASQIKPYLSLKSKICLYENKDLLTFTVKTTFVLNILMILISIIKIILEKMIYAIKNRTQPN